MAGNKYSSITAIRPSGACASGDIRWIFSCDCGVEFEANGYYARIGKIKTCPSCSKERVRRSTIKHGLSESIEFSTWTDIQTRCYNKRSASYNNYGGRGITVCNKWRASFSSFLRDMGRRPSKHHSIDRINNNGNYEPDNCRWATRIEQANNRRTNRTVKIDGNKKSIMEIASNAGLPYATVWQRIKSGKVGSELYNKSKLDGCIVFKGVRDTFAGWSRRTGIKKSTIAMRIRYGWTIDEALTKKRGCSR